MRRDMASGDAYEACVNPAWREILRQCGLDAQPAAADGSWLLRDDGRRLLDFVAGYGAAALGHNPPALSALLAQDLMDPAPNLHPLGWSAPAGELAAGLLDLAGLAGGKALFASSGAEAVEGALKLARMACGRARAIAFEGGFHGLTLAATQLAGSDFWRQGLPEDEALLRLPWGDLAAAEAALAANDVAAVVLEPVQGSAGARAWRADALHGLAALCRRHGAWLIYDEAQSGLGRCGAWFAYQALGGPPPDMLLLAKGLTGGIVPVSAILFRDAIYQAVFARPGCAKIHGSTFGGNRLAMRCGLHMLAALRGIDAPARAAARSAYLRRAWPDGLFALEGAGLMLALRATPRAKRRFGEQAAGALWLQLLSEGVLTAPAAHDADALRLLPPLTVGEDELDYFLDAYRRALAALEEEEEMP
ncbi:aspartate aminotransferase family protein [Chromobacterium sp. F49]|nr:aminotransferase class III-fold pyridoxal phosphate-dependent enzyme [Chromobacterium sp. F49]